MASQDDSSDNNESPDYLTLNGELKKACQAARRKFGYSLYEEEDLISEVLTKLIKAKVLERYGQLTDSKNYLKRIAINYVIDLYRKSQHQPEGSAISIEDLDVELSTEEQTIDRIFFKEVLELLDDEDDRFILSSWIDGMTFSKIGCEFGISKQAAYQRYEKIIQKLGIILKLTR